MQESKIIDYLLKGGSWDVKQFRIIVAPYKGFPPNNGMDKSPYGILLVYRGDLEKIAETYLYDMEQFKELMRLYDDWKSAKNEGLLNELISYL